MQVVSEVARKKTDSITLLASHATLTHNGSRWHVKVLADCKQILHPRMGEVLRREKFKKSIAEDGGSLLVQAAVPYKKGALLAPRRHIAVTSLSEVLFSWYNTDGAVRCYSTWTRWSGLLLLYISKAHTKRCEKNCWSQEAEI